MSRSPQSTERLFQPWTARLRHAGLAVALCAAPALSGCVASGEVVADYPVVEVEAVPVTITTYPHTYYAGSDVYLVDGRWYTRSRGRWVVFREEPRALATYRVNYYAGASVHAGAGARTVHQAPPAHGRRRPHR